MDYLYLIYYFVDSLKWVILVGIVFVSISAELKKLLGRISEIKYSNASVVLQSQSGNTEDEKNNIAEIESSKTVPELTKILATKDSEIKDKNEEAFKYKLEKHFEFTYRLIFKSQIYLLEKLQIIKEGIPMQKVYEHFDETKKQYHPTYEGWFPDTYLKFMFDQNLIEKDTLTGALKLTNIGDLFVNYLKINNYNYNAEKNF